MTNQEDIEDRLADEFQGRMRKSYMEGYEKWITEHSDENEFISWATSPETRLKSSQDRIDRLEKELEAARKMRQLIILEMGD